MHFFKQDNHIDPDLFELFLRSGVYLQYAREYLDPEQVDEVDIDVSSPGKRVCFSIFESIDIFRAC
jgi:hypothetical protein